MRLVRLAVALASAATLVFAATGPTRAEPITLPGTAISLEPPAGFTPATSFAGLEIPETGASFLVASLPAEAEPQIAEVFASLETASVAFFPRGIVLEDAVALGSPATPYPAYIGTQTANGVLFRKWLSLFPGAETLIVSYQAPVETADAPEVVAATLASLRTGPPPSLSEQLDALPYTLGDLGGMRVVRLMAGNATMLTIGPEDTSGDGEQPLLVVAPSFGAAFQTPPDHEAASRALLASTATMRIGEIVSARPARLAGWPGMRLEALATDDSSETPLRVVQWTGFSGTSYFRALGISSAAQWEDIRPAFETVVAGIRRREP